jgi:fluoride exporter
MRYLVAVWSIRAFGAAFPYGTFFVNLLGSFLIGLFAELAGSSAWMSPVVRVSLISGFIGGFTTYSSFSYETAQLLDAGTASLAVLNVVLTLVGCLGATDAGLAAGRWVADT